MAPWPGVLYKHGDLSSNSCYPHGGSNKELILQSGRLTSMSAGCGSKLEMPLSKWVALCNERTAGHGQGRRKERQDTWVPSSHLDQSPFPPEPHLQEEAGLRFLYNGRRCTMILWAYFNVILALFGIREEDITDRKDLMKESIEIWVR